MPSQHIAVCLVVTEWSNLHCMLLCLLVLKCLLGCMMCCKRFGLDYYHISCPLFPILSLTLNHQGVVRVSALYVCGVCPFIVLLTLFRT